ncbi:4'-phosphopantetheinyl transferase family protein [Actinokineospora sp. NPDC004072]
MTIVDVWLLTTAGADPRATTRAAARAIAARAAGIAPEDVRWRIGPHGKPDAEHVRVSWSRSGRYALVACTDARAVGVDLQVVDVAAPVRTARRFFAAVEARRVAARPGDYTRLLVRKEAWVKAEGGRLFPRLRTPVLDPVVGGCRLHDLPAPPGYAAAVALAGTADFQVRAHRWPEEDPC